MSTKIKEITKEQYTRAINKCGMIVAEDMENVFSPSELYGYGIYGNSVFTENDKFYVKYNIGSSCD